MEEIELSKPNRKKSYSVRIKPYGKADFIRRTDPITKEVIQVCECKYNVEFSNVGCIFQVSSDQLQEVYENFGSYNPEHTGEYRRTRIWPNNKCTYCYERSLGNVFPRSVDELTRQDFSEFNPRYIRVGKRTEPGHIWYNKSLRDFLLLSKEFGASLIFTTKALSFGLSGIEQAIANSGNNFLLKIAEKEMIADENELAELFKITNSTLLYSIGSDSQEPGAVSQGFTNNWRIQQALGYFQQSVNTSLTGVADVTNSIEHNIERGSSISQLLKANKQHGINIRIIPLRPNRKVYRHMCGGEWKDSVQRPGEVRFEFDKRSYTRRKDHFAFPNLMHPDFKELYESGIEFCGRVGDYEYCGKCNLYPDNPQRIYFPVSQIPKLEKRFKSKPIKKNRLKKENKKAEKAKRISELDEINKQQKLF